MSHNNDAIIRWRHINDVTCSKSSFEFRVLGWLNMILIQSKNLSKIIFFVIHEKTWISWYSRILTNFKTQPTLPSNLPTRSISSVEVPLFIFVLKLILSKIAAFLSKIALCRNSPSFCQFSPKTLFNNFWLFNFCFWLFVKTRPIFVKNCLLSKVAYFLSIFAKISILQFLTF